MFHCRDGLQFIYSSTEGLLGSFQVLSVMTCYCCLVTKSCLTLCDPLDCSPPGSSVHGVLQVRILEFIAISFSRGSSQAMDQTWVSCTAGRFFPIWATSEDYYFLIAIEVKCHHVAVPHGDVSECDAMMKWFKLSLWKWKCVPSFSQCLKSTHERERSWSS